MRSDEYLKTYQPIIYKTFENALSNHLLSHAYLIVGEPGTPLLDITKYLAKSILCDNGHPFACNRCITCQRIDDKNYPDFIIFDGSKSSIKKGEIDQLETEFEKKAFEKKGIKIYILHLVENMTIQAINAILKFLEEPGQQIYAFLTTNNESLILPTTISRCQTMHLKLIDRQIIIDDAISNQIEPLDAQLLSFIYNDVELIENALRKDENYRIAKEALLDLLNYLVQDKNKAIFEIQRISTNHLSSKEATRFFFDLLIACLQDMHNIKYQKTPYLQDIKDILQQINEKIDDVDNVLIDVLKLKNILNLNINNSLLLDHLSLILTKEQKHG